MEAIAGVSIDRVPQSFVPALLIHSSALVSPLLQGLVYKPLYLSSFSRTQGLFYARELYIGLCTQSIVSFHCRVGGFF